MQSTSLTAGRKTMLKFKFRLPFKSPLSFLCVYSGDFKSCFLPIFAPRFPDHPNKVPNPVRFIVNFAHFNICWLFYSLAKPNSAPLKIDFWPKRGPFLSIFNEVRSLATLSNQQYKSSYTASFIIRL